MWNIAIEIKFWFYCVVLTDVNLKDILRLLACLDVVKGRHYSFTIHLEYARTRYSIWKIWKMLLKWKTRAFTNCSSQQCDERTAYKSYKWLVICARASDYDSEQSIIVLSPKLINCLSLHYSQIECLICFTNYI